MDRRRLLAGGGAVAAGTATLATPNFAAAQPQVRWRCAGSFPKLLDTLYGTQEYVCRRVSEMTDGAFQIQAFGPDEVAPALQVMDVVGQGSVECGYTAASYYADKDPSLAIASCLPFGLNSRQMWSWLHSGGGREALAPLYRDQGVHGIPAGNTGAQMGGWFRREIRSVPDLQGLKFRIAGIGGIALQRLGVTPHLLPGGGIYTALTSGEVDAAEWVGPYDDEKLGLNRAAQFYYYPGWWEWAPSFDLMVNLRAWEGLPDHYKAVLEAAGAEGWHWMMQRYDAQNPPAARRLIASGTQLRVFPQEVMRACYNACQDLYAELGERNARFKQIHEGWDRFRRETQAWFGIAEDSLANFLVTESQQRR
jgi:TRAP-type mannitol/chloroaromatic compound transport system substrate-binding protein